MFHELRVKKKEQRKEGTLVVRCQLYFDFYNLLIFRVVVGSVLGYYDFGVNAHNHVGYMS